MISRLPRWVYPAAGVLALVAGMTNVVGLLSLEHQSISHVTGTTSILGTALAEGAWEKAWRLGSVVLAFFGGAALSGAVVGGHPLTFGARYGTLLLLEGSLLAAGGVLLPDLPTAGALLASVACGLQNAMASTYTGSIVRTTHLSGVVTDLGTFFGLLLRRQAIDVRRVKLSVIVLVSYILGSVAGTMSYWRWGVQSLFGPAVITGVAGLGCSVSLLRQRGLR